MKTVQGRSLLLIASLLVVVVTVGFNATTEIPKKHVALSSSADDGEELYMTRCMSCHQANGDGISGVFPPLTNSEWVTGDKGRLIRLILNGMAGEVEVNGVIYTGAMPPWNTFLNDEQVAAVLTYIRSSWGNEANEVTVEEVAAVREATKDKKDQWTAEDLLKDENTGIPGQQGFPAFLAPKDSTSNQ